MQLNYYTINFDFDKYQVTTTPYSDERLKHLREAYNLSHSFFRHGDSIFISNKNGDDDLILGELVERQTYLDKEVTASLIKHIFFRTFKDRFVNYTPVDFYPFRFFSNLEDDDIIYKALPDNLKNKIGYKKLIEVQLRSTTIGGVQRFGFTINIKRNWIFNKNCLDLKNEGYNLIGVEVVHAEILPGMKHILAPNEEFIGAITEISDTDAKVLTNEGLKKYALEELFIVKTKLNIGNYLAFATSLEKSNEILNIIELRRSEIYNAKILGEEIKKIAKALFKNKLDGNDILFKNKDGFCFTVDSSPLEVKNTIELKTPTFIYDYSGTKTNSVNADQGLTNYGPYDSINFDIKSPNILCICHRENRGFFSQFLANLKDGIPSSTYFKKGLLKKYELLDIQYNINQVSSYDIEEYLNIIKGDEDNKPSLAIIEIPSEFRKLKDDKNPYFKIKAKLLSLEIPVQYITTDKIKNCTEYILNSIALQIYAKLGGTPWVLPSNRSVDREIIIGIGHSLLRSNAYKNSDQTKVVGITTFLSSDGQYLLADKVKDVAFDEYFDELLKSLNQSFDRLEKEQGWSEGDTVRLIFHIFKPIKNTEFDVICKFVKSNTKYKIKFAFVTISKSHPNLLFDPSQRGIMKFNSSKGEYIPSRGSNVFLDSETCIVQMFGPNEMKTSKQGMSNPIQIKIRIPQGGYENSDLSEMLYYDLSYIVQQIFSFTYLSWRSFLPGEEPATMRYSNLISKLLSQMRSVDGWDPDHLNYGLKRKKWFL